MKLIDMNTVDFQAAFTEPKTVIIPVGAFEVWGPHLPLGADTLMADAIANRLAKRMGWIVGPTLPVGDSSMVWGPGTITVRPESLRMYLEDVCESLVKHGAKRFVFMSPHVGNTSIISQISWKLKAEHDVTCCIFDWWRFIQPICTQNNILEHEGQMAHGHASEAGTSCFLYLYPELVKMERACKTLNKKQNDYPDVIQFFPFADCSDTWVIGDATCASVEKGEKIVNASLDRMEAFLRNW